MNLFTGEFNLASGATFHTGSPRRKTSRSRSDFFATKASYSAGVSTTPSSWSVNRLWKFPRSFTYGLSMPNDRGRPLLITHDRIWIEGVPIARPRYTGWIVNNWAMIDHLYRWEDPDEYGWHQFGGIKSDDEIFAYLLDRPNPTLESIFQSGIPFLFSDVPFWSSQAFSRFKPTRMSGALGQAIAEIREVPRLPYLSSLERNLTFFKALGNEYLNVQFGWRPFLQDLQDFLRNTIAFHQRWQQLFRDNGQNIRRRGRLFTDKSPVTEEVLTPRFPKSDAVSSLALNRDVNLWTFKEGNTSFQVPQNPDWEDDAYPLYGIAPVHHISKFDIEPTPPTYVRQQYDESYVDFAGSFRYAIPKLPGFSQSRALYRIAYGAELTPHLVWELLPFSWLIDWFTNVGDLIDHAFNDHDDHVLCSYGYLTASLHSVQRYTIKERLNLYDASNGLFNPSYRDNPYLDYCLGIPVVGPYGPSVCISNTIKTRMPIGPFGFGFKHTALTSTQIAILAALGIAYLVI